MEEKLTQFKELLYEIADLVGAQSVLGWDQQTYMPPGGSESRGEQLSTLAKITHDRFISDELGALLEDLNPYADQIDPNSDDARLIKVTSREYLKQRRIPSEWVSEFAQLTTVAQDAWVTARTDSNYHLFEPLLQRVVDLRRQYANFFAPYSHIYDPLLDDYEPGLKTGEVQEIFNKMRPVQVELIKAIKDKPEIDDSYLHVTLDEQKQWDFGVEVISKFGYDWQRGRQDKAAHPFTTSFGAGDVRITTRFIPESGSSALFSTMHECGHALYEQGLSPTLRRTLLMTGSSMALHESQSRMWENLVGRSKEFWECFYPKYQSLFPETFSNINQDDFYKGINKVIPSLVRVEADEATYNLHIMLRLELEIGLMDGSIPVKDLPEIWNAKMKDYLGLVPSDDAHGVLQDIHWSGGMIGYFPTYALGNLVSVQLWEKINEDIPALPGYIRQGNFEPLLSWLHEKVHVHGAKFDPQDMVKQITGSTITPEPYLRYLTKKYSEIYKL